MRATMLLATFCAVAVAFFAYTQLTIFVVAPIGALPEGRTILTWRTGKLEFIDSADAVCERTMGGVSLLCRAAVLAGLGKADAVITSFPYSDFLYLASTGGKRYDR